MKQHTKLYCLLLLAAILQNCSQKEDATPSKEKVQFLFDLNTLKSGRISSSSLPAGTSLRLSIKKSTGETVHSLLPVELLHAGSSILTAPIELPTGNYKVTDFLLVNIMGEVTYATPKAGSTMAGLVINPLDFNFSVVSGITTNSAMEVIDVTQSSPADFGYATFDLSIIHPLRISVYSGTHHVTAKAYILHGADTLQFFDLAARINLVAFREETDVPYTLVVIKGAYGRYSLNFVYEDLMTTLAGQPLKIYLTPAFTFKGSVNTIDTDLFSVQVAGASGGNITVDWGDGSLQPYVLNTTSVALEHNYAVSGSYFTTITGDINTITYFYSFYGQGKISEINFNYLTELNELRFGLTASPKVLDLTHNTKLIQLRLPNLDNTKNINLPVINKINFIDVSGPNLLTIATLSSIIDKVHHAAVVDNRHNGTFEFAKTWWPETDVMVKTPTPAALAKLRELRDTYGWSIHPNP